MEDFQTIRHRRFGND